MLLDFSYLFGTWVRLGHRDGSRPALNAEHCAGAARRRPARLQTAHSGRNSLQQHPSRAGGEARRARGGAAAGRRSGWDPADPVHRLAGSARYPRERRRGAEDNARRRNLATAPGGLERGQTDPPT